MNNMSQNKAQIGKEILQNGISKMLDDAKVPLKVHLQALKNIADLHKKQEENNQQIKKLLLEHVRQLATHEQHERTHAQQFGAFQQEVERSRQMVKGEKGDTGESIKGDPGLDAPQLEEIVAAVLPHIPAPIPGEKGRDAEIDVEAFKKEMLEYLKGKIEVPHIKGAQDFIMRTSQKTMKVKFEELMHGAGKGGGGGFTELDPTGAINGINAVFTFQQTPTYIISDGAWYKNGNGFTLSGLIATMNVPPSYFIFGIA